MHAINQLAFYFLLLFLSMSLSMLPLLSFFLHSVMVGQTNMIRRGGVTGLSPLTYFGISF